MKSISYTKEEKAREAMTLKKGPWTAEEDGILSNFVAENGAKNWSSIRSKTFLLRSGKSCRLRWVNKLRPGVNLQSRLTEEEKQFVVMMQARIGNKWATIAGMMPGRTDNDVKNYWSTRKKKQAKLLIKQQQLNGMQQEMDAVTTLSPSLTLLDVTGPQEYPLLLLRNGEDSLDDLLLSLPPLDQMDGIDELLSDTCDVATKNPTIMCSMFEFPAADPSPPSENPQPADLSSYINGDDIFEGLQDIVPYEYHCSDFTVASFPIDIFQAVEDAVPLLEYF